MALAMLSAIAGPAAAGAQDPSPDSREGDEAPPPSPTADASEDVVRFTDYQTGHLHLARRRELTKRQQVLAQLTRLDEEGTRTRPEGSVSIAEVGFGFGAGRPCRYLVRLPGGQTRRTPPRWGCLILPHVDLSVRRLPDGDIRYRYRIRNRSGSGGSIRSFAVELPRLDVLRGAGDAGGWLLLALEGKRLDLSVFYAITHRREARWVAPLLPEPGCMEDTAPLGAGEHVGRLSITSRYLPNAVWAHFRSDVYLGESPNADLVAAKPIPGGNEGFSAHLDYDVLRVTLGPAIPPPGVDPRARWRAVSALIDGLGYAMHAGWIDAENARALHRALSLSGDADAQPDQVAAVVEEIGAMRMRGAYRRAILLGLRELTP